MACELNASACMVLRGHDVLEADHPPALNPNCETKRHDSCLEETSPAACKVDR